MSDRELLELAAKAAGIVGEYGDCHPEFGSDFGGTGIWYNDIYDCVSLWNPLVSLSDAMHLAVNRRISILFSGDTVDAMWSESDTDAFYVTEQNIDEYSVQLAIVRAAAEIGKAMQ